MEDDVGQGHGVRRFDDGGPHDLVTGGVADSGAFERGGPRHAPGSGSKQRCLEGRTGPAEPAEPLALLVGNRSIDAAWPHVEQQVAALGDDVHQRPKQFVVPEEVLGARCRVIREAVIHPPDALPRHRLGFGEARVLRGADIEVGRLGWDEASVGDGLAASGTIDHPPTH